MLKQNLWEDDVGCRDTVSNSNLSIHHPTELHFSPISFRDLLNKLFHCASQKKSIFLLKLYFVLKQPYNPTETQILNFNSIINNQEIFLIFEKYPIYYQYLMSTNKTFPEDQVNQSVQKVPKSKKNRKEKPWDDPNADHWKLQQIKPQQCQPFVQESSFSVLFPQYREKYIQECQGIVKKKLMDFGIKFQLNLLEGSMTVRTTKKTYDPYAIIKARDVIKLISRSVPYQNSLKVMEDGVFSQIIKISSFVRNKERFIKRRQRLIGPNGDTLKALELLTECYILVQGSTVCIIGNFKQVKVLRRIIVDTMQNIHPIYHIKQLMIKRELMKDETLKETNWDKFLPKFKQIRMKKKKSKVKRQVKQYNPFPPQQIPRKQDIQMETGEYFLSQAEQHKNKMGIKKQKQQQKMREKQEQKEVNHDEQKEIERQKKKQYQKEEGKRAKSKHQQTIEELKEKFLSKPIKKVKFL